MSLSDERRKRKRAERAARVETSVSISPSADQTYLNVGRQLVALKKSDGRSAEELKPMVMSAVVESGNEGTLVCGFISQSLEVSAAVSFCDITLAHLEDTARKSFQATQYGGRRHPEAKRIREKVRKLPREIVEQIVIDTVIAKEGATLAYLRGLRNHLEHEGAIAYEIGNLISQLETISRRISQGYGMHQ